VSLENYGKTGEQRTMEQRISSTDLMGQLQHVLTSIREREVVFIVELPDTRIEGFISGLIDSNGKVSFVIGPPALCGRIFGLIDPELVGPRMFMPRTSKLWRILCQVIDGIR
jgi:hypothetical protein